MNSKKTGEVGLAKPISDEVQSTPSPKVEQPTIQPIAATTSDSTFSSIVGMSVYDSNAKKVGTAKQVGINSSHQVVLVITNKEGSDMTIDWAKIKKNRRDNSSGRWF